jgi:hypothetical protein
VANNPRETVFQALYDLLLTANYPFTLVNLPTLSPYELGLNGRLMQQWDQAGSGAQPAMYLQEGMQKAEQNTPQGNLGLNRWTYNAKVWFFFRRDTQSVLPATVYNEILDAVDAVITPIPGKRQTLAAQNGGVPLVVNVRVTEAAWDEGTLDPQGGQCIVYVGLEVLTSN